MVRAFQFRWSSGRAFVTHDAWMDFVMDDGWMDGVIVIVMVFNALYGVYSTG